MSLLSECVAGLMNAIPVIVGGFIAGVTGVVCVIWSHRLQSAAEKSILLRSKLEAVVCESYKVETWKRKLVAAQAPIASFSVEKMQAVAALYFPEIDQKVTALALATLDYQGHFQKILGEQQNKNQPLADNDSRLAELGYLIDEAQWEVVKAARAFALKKRLVDV